MQLARAFVCRWCAVARLRAAGDCLQRMREKRLDRQVDDLKRQIAAADDEGRRTLLRQLMELQNARQKQKEPNERKGAENV